MASYRRFTKHDWDAFAGSEAFTDGSQPFIYEKAFEYNKDVMIVIVVDKNGVQVQLIGGEPGEEDNIWIKDEPLTALIAEGYLRKLIDYTSKYTYAPDLAYELDHPSDEITEGFEFC